MKKLLLLIAIFNIIALQAQKFELTSNGFVDINDQSKNYLVLDFPGKPKEQLFKEALIYFNKNYISSKDVISKVDNEVITVNAISPNPIRLGGFEKYTNNYNITISFKDEKIKIDAPSVDLSYIAGGRVYRLFVSNEKTSIMNQGIYGKNGKLNYKKAKEGLEEFAESFVLNLKLGLSNESQNNDW